MEKSQRGEREILDAIRTMASELGRPPSRAEFKARTGIPESLYTKFFQGWRDALYRAGLKPDTTNVRLDDGTLLEDWGNLVRRLHRIPTKLA